MWGEEGVGEIGLEAPASKEDDSMEEEEERGERERLTTINLCLFFVCERYVPGSDGVQVYRA